MSDLRRARLTSRLRRLADAGPGAPPGEAPPRHEATPARPEAAAAPAPEAPREAEGRAARIERLRALVRQTLARPRASSARPLGPPAQARQDLPGERVETPDGPLHVLDRTFEPHHCHGRVPVARALEVDAPTLATLSLDGALAGVDPRRLLFLDTETTGLAGGTGTVPFLIGLAWFEDESLRVEQLLLRRLGEEAPMLRRLAARVEACSALVTFNGKAFDWPLLRTRAVLGRVPLPTPPAHLDLLHCARRVFRWRLEEGVRLVQLEAEVLGLCREHDVDGAEIPGLYFAFLRGAEGAAMQPVLEHNALDLLALAALVARLGLHYAREAVGDDPRDQLGFATVAERAGDADRAARLAQTAVAEGALAPAHALRAHRLVATVARRRRDVHAERAALEAALAVAASEGDAARLHLALAKLHEHRTRDFAAALAHAEHAGAAEPAEAAARRRARLVRRLDARAPTGAPLFVVGADGE